MDIFKINGFKCISGKLIDPELNPRMHVTGIVTGINSIQITSYNNITKPNFDARMAVLANLSLYRPICYFYEPGVQIFPPNLDNYTLISSYNPSTQILVSIYGIAFSIGTVVHFEVFDIWAPFKGSKPVSKLSVINNPPALTVITFDIASIAINIPTTFRGIVEVAPIKQVNVTTNSIILLN